MTFGNFKRDRPARRHAPEMPLPLPRTKRSAQRGRRGTFWLLIFGCLVLLVAAAPSLICRTPLAKAIVHRQMPHYSLEGSFESVRFGWVTPLRLSGLDVTGTAGGTRLRVDRLDSGVTLLRCLGGLRDGESFSARGVSVELTVDDDWSSFEADLAALAAGRRGGDEESEHRSSAPPPRCTIDVQSLTLRVADKVSGASWTIDQARAEATVDENFVEARFSAILSDPQAGSGSLDATVRYNAQPGDFVGELNLQGLPLGAASLIRRRFPQAAAALPRQLSGDATGAVQMSLSGDGVWSLTMQPLELRNLIASDPALGEHTWRNSLAVAEGTATIDNHGLRGSGLRLTTDFAQFSLDGAFAGHAQDAQGRGAISWLNSLDGTAAASVDLVAMTDALPGIIPLRDQARLLSGSIVANVTSRPETATTRRIEGNFQSQPIHAQAAGRRVVIEPATVVASLSIDQAGLWKADRCELTSSFGSATLDGDLSRGRATADLDLGRLAAMLEPLIDVKDLTLGGAGSGQMQWSAQSGNLWRLHGDGNATDLIVGLPGGIQLHRPELAIHIDAGGRWDGTTLSELTAAEVSLRSHSLEVDASLAASVPAPTLDKPLPLKLRGRGRLEVLAEFLSPWLPQSLHSLRGGFHGEADALVSLAAGELRSANAVILDARGGWAERVYSQNEITIALDGNYAWPSGNLSARSLKVSGEAVSATLQGTLGDEAIDCHIQWRGDLEALQGTVQPLMAQMQGPAERSTPFTQGPGERATTVAFAGATRAAGATQWRLVGHCEGSARLVRHRGVPLIGIQTQVAATDLRLMEHPGAAANQSIVDPRLPAASAPRTAGRRVIWSEPSLKFDGALQYDWVSGRVDANELQLTSDWFATTLGGEIHWNESRGSIQLGGPARIAMARIAPQLSSFAGTPIRLEGVHQTPVELSVTRRTDGTADVRLTANVGWDGGEVAGVVFGPSVVPLVMSESTVALGPANIPVGQGRVSVAGEVHYQPGPIRMDVAPGVIAQNVRVTPELTERWLQYLAPMVARATRVDGTFGVDLSAATIDFEDPARSRVRGQLQISRVDFDSGPVADQLLSSIQQIQMIARGKPPAEAPPPSRRLATLPTQSVDFDVADGIITHQRMFMEIDRAHLVTSGQVHIDGRLNLVTQVPLDAAWLGNDLKALAGRTVTLPVGGTLSQPRLDPSAIRDLVAQVGVQAIQSSAENYLEKQINRGLERLLGK